MSSSYILDSEAVGCDEIWSTAWDSSGKVWTGGLDGQLRCYDASKSRETPCASGSAASSSGCSLGIVSVDASDSFVLTNQIHSELTRWALEPDGISLRKQASSSLGANNAWSISLHPSEEIVATAAASASLKLFKASVQDFAQLVHAAPPSSSATSSNAKADFASCCKFSPDGKLVAVSATSGQVFLVGAFNARRCTPPT